MIPPLVGESDREGERDLVGRAQRGDLEAFEALYRAHSGRVFALCLRLTGERIEAAGLLQDAFVRAWERLATFRGEAALTTWLHRLTVNCFLEESRKTRRRESRIELHETHDMDAPTGAEVRDSQRTGSDRGSRSQHSGVAGSIGTTSSPDFSKAVDARLDLEAALPRLPEGARRVFVLHDMYGYRHDEIATLLGVAAATVRVQLFRARKQLMEMLDR